MKQTQRVPRFALEQSTAERRCSRKVQFRVDGVYRRSTAAAHILVPVPAATNGMSDPAHEEQDQPDDREDDANDKKHVQRWHKEREEDEGDSE